MNDLNANLKKIVFEMIRSGAPERATELSEMWETYAPEFIYSGDKPNFVLEAGAYRSLRLTDRTLRLIWMFGYIAWKTLHLYGGLIHVYSAKEAVFDVDEIETDPEHESLNSEIQSLLKKFHDFKATASVADCEWPSLVPAPAHCRPTNDDEETAVYDLVGMAMVYVFLHELKHIQFSSDLMAPPCPIKEELMCDKYARSFLFEKVANYSKTSGDALEKVISKRAMAVALASFLIFELTPTEARYGTDSHPPIGQRIRHVLDFPALKADDNYWLYLGSILITKLRLMGAKPQAFRFNTKKNFCEKVFEVFANHALQPTSGRDAACLGGALRSAS